MTHEAMHMLLHGCKLQIKTDVFVSIDVVARVLCLSCCKNVVKVFAFLDVARELGCVFVCVCVCVDQACII